MKKFLLFIYLVLVGNIAYAGATNPLRRAYSVKQSDGTTLEIEKCAIDNFVFYRTDDGLALTRGENGDLQYAKLVPNGIIGGGMCAHELSLRSDFESKFIASHGVTVDDACEWLNSLRKKDGKSAKSIGNGRGDGLGTLGVSGHGVVKSIGTPVIPVIMVEFSDMEFMPETTPLKVSRMFNEEGYKDEKYCVGSVKDYFISQSGGLFKPSYEVLGKFKVSKPYSYYGENYPNGAIDKNSSVLVQEVLDSALVSGIDFKRFVSDNGQIPLVSIFYAGPGEHSSFEKGCEDYIWAHFSERHFNVGGIVVNSSLVGNEVQQSYDKSNTGEMVVTGKSFDGIGILVHEFSHALGLPDFYSTRGNSREMPTPYFWSVMDYGQYFFEGYRPIGYSAFERNSLGWLDIQELTEARYAELYTFGQEGNGVTAYCIRNAANRNEYFILENRQKGVWYPASIGHGMLITHVDYDYDIWSENIVNIDKDHLRYTVVPADNVVSGRDEDGRVVWDYFKSDLFPGLKNVIEFTDNTLPSSTVFTGGTLKKPIYNIKEEGGVISFSFINKELTGITKNELNGVAEDVEVYTLAGLRISKYEKLQPGVYLMKKGNLVKRIYTGR